MASPWVTPKYPGHILDASCYPLLKKDFIYSFLEKGREGEKYQCVVAFCMPRTGDLAHNPGVCPDWELNWRPFGLQASTQSTKPHQPGLLFFLFLKNQVY